MSDPRPRRGVRRALLVTAAIALAVVAARVYLDAATHGHRRGDGSLWQPPGSFVTIERWVGATRPTRWGRPIEYAVALSLGLTSLVALIKALRER